MPNFKKHNKWEKQNKKNKQNKQKWLNKQNKLNIEKKFNCPCGGGQSCIVDRRRVGDWVYEDDIFKKHKLPLRKDCYSPLSLEQTNILKIYIQNF